jgi:hypothetical protein
LICDAEYMERLEFQFGSSFMASGIAPWQYQVSGATQLYAAADQLQAGYKRQRGPGNDLQAHTSGGCCRRCGRISYAWVDQGQIDAAKGWGSCKAHLSLEFGPLHHALAPCTMLIILCSLLPFALPSG